MRWVGFALSILLVMCLAPKMAESVAAPSCFLSPDPGPCHAAIPRYYYDIDDGACYTFIYGGCGGNGNNFETLWDCDAACALIDGGAAAAT